MRDVRKIAGWIQITPELRAEVLEGEHWTDPIGEALLDQIDGPRFGPGRSQLWDIERPERIAANLRANLGNGRPAGPVRRA